MRGQIHQTKDQYIDTIRIQLNYPPSVVDRPIIFLLVRDFHLITDIRRASIDPRTGGFIFVELSGARTDLERAIKWLEQIGIGVDAIGVDGTQEWAV